MRLRVDCQHAGQGAEVKLQGSLTGSTAAALITKLKRQLEMETLDRPLQVDMQEVEYVDSSGVGAILKLHRTVEDEGGQLTFHSLNPFVSQMFGILSLHKVISISDVVKARDADEAE